MSQAFTAPVNPAAETQEQTIARLIAENAALKAKNPVAKRFSNPTLTDLGNGVSVAVGEKHGLCIYGLGGTKRFPINISELQFMQLFTLMPTIQAWMNQPIIKAELSKRAQPKLVQR